MRWRWIFLTCAAVAAFLAWHIAGLRGLDTTLKAGLASSERLSEDQRLFRDLIEAKLITVTPDGLLRPVASDSWMTLDPSAPEAKKAKKLLDWLYNTDVGNLIRRQIRYWNQMRAVAAVRDNRGQTSAKSHWKALDPTFRQPVAAGERVPIDFGYVDDDGLPPHFTDWLTAPGASAEAKPVLFETELDGSAVRIQVIGRIKRIALNGVDAPIARRPACPRGKTQCTDAVALAFNLETGKLTGTLGIQMEPVVATGALHFPGLAISASTDMAHLEADPKTAGKAVAAGGFAFLWASPDAATVRHETTFRILSRDGVELMGTDGKPTAEATEAGLIPIIGSGKDASYALAGRLAATRLLTEGSAISLTIDSRYQRAAQQALQDKVNFLASNPSNRDYADERRAALVILNADTGAILATAGLPNIPKGVHPWDLVAFARAYPTADPAKVRAWQGADKHSTPGSVFKPLTALALIKGAKDDQKVAGVLEGLSAPNYQKLIGHPGHDGYAGDFNPAWHTDHKHPITNVGPYKPNKPLLEWKRCEAIHKRLGISNRDFVQKLTGGGWDLYKENQNLGLPQGIRDSVNTYFAASVNTMDFPGDQCRQKGSSFLDRIEDLGVFQPLDLAANLKGREPLSRIAGDVLYAEPVSADARCDGVFGEDRANCEQKKAACHGEFKWRVLQASFGQGLLAPPLRVATVASMIATGKQVSPYLIDGWNDNQLPPSPSADLSVTAKQLTPLRLGMKAVVEKGTTSGIFDGTEECLVFGKSGTAEIGSDDSVDELAEYRSVSFIGWREPLDKDLPRIAFACSISHVVEEFGGRTCGGVINDFLKRLKAATKS